jgi:hypothetical protein
MPAGKILTCEPEGPLGTDGPQGAVVFLGDAVGSLLRTPRAEGDKGPEIETPARSMGLTVRMDRVRAFAGRLRGRAR